MAQTTPSSTSVSFRVTSAENYRRPLAMVTTLFFMWGFLTSLNDILIPHFKDGISISTSERHVDSVCVFHCRTSSFRFRREN